MTKEKDGLTTEFDHIVRNGLITVGIIMVFTYGFFSYIHWQMASASDCSLITTENDTASMVYGQKLSVQQNRDLCFDMFSIHKVELCYYITCGDDVNQTVNYEGQPIKHALDFPEKTHLYPVGDEKFTIFDVTFFKVMFIVFGIAILMPVVLVFHLFRDPKEEPSNHGLGTHGTLPKDWGK